MSGASRSGAEIVVKVRKSAEKAIEVATRKMEAGFKNKVPSVRFLDKCLPLVYDMCYVLVLI